MTLTEEVMFVNYVDFMFTLSRNIRLFTAEHVPSCTASQLSNSLNRIVNLYYQGLFVVGVVLIYM